MTDYGDSERWFLAASISRGRGRSWLVTLHHLTEVEPGEQHMATASYADARRYVREEHRVPLHWEQPSERLTFGYVDRRYVEGMGDD